MNITFWSLFGIVSYFVLIFFVGYFAYRRSTKGDVTDYFLAGRAIGPVVLIGTLFATWFSTFAFIGGPAFYYELGVGWLLHSFFNVFGALCIWFIGSRFWVLGKKFNFITPADLLGDYYRHEGVRILVAIICIIALFPYAAIQLSGISKTVEGLTDGQIPYWVGILLVSIGVGIYAYFGGARAVVWTDAIQGFLFAAFLIWFSIAVVNWAGGWETGWANAVAAHPERMTFSADERGNYFTNQLLWTFGWVLTPHLWQRMYMAKSARVLNISMAAAAGLSLWTVAFTGAIIGFMGMGIIPELPQGVDADFLSALLLRQFAPAAGVLLLVAVFAAGMSTVDSQLLCASSVFTSDIYQKYVNRRASSETLERVGHIFTILFIIAILGFTLIPAGQGLIAPLASIGVGLCLLFLPAVIGALYWERATPVGAFWGLLVGFIVFLLAQFVPGISGNLPGGLGAPFWGFVVNLLLFIALSLNTPPLPAEHRQEYHGFLKAFNTAGSEREIVPARVD